MVVPAIVGLLAYFHLPVFSRANSVSNFLPSQGSTERWQIRIIQGIVMLKIRHGRVLRKLLRILRHVTHLLGSACCSCSCCFCCCSCCCFVIILCCICLLGVSGCPREEANGSAPSFEKVIARQSNQN